GYSASGYCERSPGPHIHQCETPFDFEVARYSRHNGPITSLERRSPAKRGEKGVIAFDVRQSDHPDWWTLGRVGRVRRVDTGTEIVFSPAPCPLPSTRHPPPATR